MDMVGKVRRMKLRDQLSISEIPKRTGLSRKTVKKWLKAAGMRSRDTSPLCRASSRRLWLRWSKR